MHEIIDVASMIPVVGIPFDAANAVIYLAEGNVAEAGMSVVGMVPVFGDALTGSRLALKGGKKIVNGAKALDSVPGGNKIVAQAQKNVNGVGHNAKKVAGDMPTNCFTEGTQIVVGMKYDDNGVFVQYITAKIEDIQVGDLVYSYDTATGEVSQKSVTDTFSNTSNHINLLTIIDDLGNEQVIETTDGHPFWVVTDEPDLSRAARSIIDENGVALYHENLDGNANGYWVHAKDLRVGDVFLGANGELSTLTNTVRVDQECGIGIFNFTVEGNHNYFILAKEYEYGQSCVLVHNTSPVTIEDAAAEISKKINKNRVTIKTPNKEIDYDLVGKPHFDKPTQQAISTPHVHEKPIARGPNGRTSIDTKNATTRPATPQDIRIVKRFLNE